MTIKNHLKLFVRNIVEEAVLKEIAGANVDAVTATARLAPNQRQVVAALMQRKFKPAKYIDAGNNQVSVVLEQPYSGTSDEGNRFAHVTPNGRINRDQLDLKTFLKGAVDGVITVPDGTTVPTGTLADCAKPCERIVAGVLTCGTPAPPTPADELAGEASGFTTLAGGVVVVGVVGGVDGGVVVGVVVVVAVGGGAIVLGFVLFKQGIFSFIKCNTIQA